MTRCVNTSAIMGATALLASAAPALATEARYTCSGGDSFTADFSPPGAAKGQVILSFGMGRQLTLPQVLSADGGRYANGDTEFWIKGRSATLTMNGAKETCATP